MNASSTNTTFYLNTSKTSFDNAEIACQRNGGHLAAYVDFVEQYEVEQALINAGYLIADYHLYYWIGYRATTWPKFYALDKTVPFDSPLGNYTYWGYFNNSAAPVEPDGGIYGNQLCVAANYTEAYADLSGTGGGNGSVAFGWADNSCSMALPFMCRINRESTPPNPPCLAACLSLQRGCVKPSHETLQLSLPAAALDPQCPTPLSTSPTRPRAPTPSIPTT